MVRRLLDGRHRIIVADGGLTVTVLAYTRNAAHALLCAIDQPEAGHRSSVGHYALSGADKADAQLRWAELVRGRWPVVANSPTVVAISRAAYDRVGGFAHADTIDAALADFAQRARAHGLLSLCDSRLAVVVRGDAIDADRSAPTP